ncbi:alpha/beta fold hydrolase [Aeromicrobium sp. Leaf350]|uniref:alpha/beta fold hydrolase n=1 Tax=Aeromicrobium sp. Leaf350 TaxID=2876565 RepID=UPI001E4F65C6|nr:alpha/beta fold hydrolase [Aeromicrobium sp. Leaf350]
MTTPALTGTALGGADEAPLLLLGPSLGTPTRELWAGAAAHLTGSFRVVGWDLPGHSSSAPTTETLDVPGLAAGVLALADHLAPGRPLHLAGDSLGGAVTLQLAHDRPDRVASATVLCTGARIGTPESWAERAATVRASGTSAVVTSSAARWFSPGFMEREPAVASALLTGLAHTDAESYALACEALAAFDLVARLPEITVPVLAIAGADDVPTPVESLRTIADGVAHGRLVVLDGVGHLAPAEAPAEVARLIHEHATAGGPR